MTLSAIKCKAHLARQAACIAWTHGVASSRQVSECIHVRSCRSTNIFHEFNISWSPWHDITLLYTFLSAFTLQQEQSAILYEKSCVRRHLELCHTLTPDSAGSEQGVLQLKPTVRRISHYLVYVQLGRACPEHTVKQTIARIPLNW